MSWDSLGPPLAKNRYTWPASLERELVKMDKLILLLCMSSYLQRLRTVRTRRLVGAGGGGSSNAFRAAESNGF